MAFVLDVDGCFARRANGDSIIWRRIGSGYWERHLRDLVEAHVRATDSRWARGLLEDWDRTLSRIWQVVPKEMLDRLPQPLEDCPMLVQAAE
jgi:glutamate synthase (NADPH/NADH) large chain